VDDCLIWSGDDAITPKQDRTYDAVFPPRNIQDHTYTNIIAFTRKAAVKIGSETEKAGKEFYNMTFRNFDVVYADRAVCIWSEGGALINYINFEDFRIEKISTEYKQAHIHCRIDAEGNSIKNVSFVNISAKEPAPLGSTFNGDNLNSTIDGKKVQYYNISFRNYIIGGQPVLSLEDSNARFDLQDDHATADSSAFSFEAAFNTFQNFPEAPEEISIYPNPFDSSCHIEFNIERPDKVQITVRNLEGNLIDTLINARLQQGMHTVTWQADANSPGIFLINLQTGNRQVWNKVVKI